jgi:hypothetical protein
MPKLRQKDETSVTCGLISIFVFLLLLISFVFSAPTGSESKRVFVTVNGTSADDLFGHNVSGIGDFNGDSYDDTIVGAPGVNSRRGSAYIFFGGPWFNGSLSADSANVTLNGSVSGDLFGWDVSDAGNVNNDNYDDIIIGAPGNNSDAGVAYIFLGGNSLPKYLNANDADAILIGENGGDQFGFSVSSAGDVNKDIFDDVMVGAPGTDTQTGTANVFFGDDPMSSQINSFDANVTMFGENTQDRFGHSVSDAGDVNDDDFDDVIIGAPGADKSYIYFGGDPMNKWLQTTQSDFDTVETKVHINTTSVTDGEAQLETFHDIKAMMSYYDDGDIFTPRNSSWDQTSWSIENSANSIGADENYWFDIESGTVRKNEKILAVLDSGLDINVQVSDGKSWSAELELINVASFADYKCFDLAYESKSGDALLVYYNKSNGNTPNYRIWNGTEWSNEWNASINGTDDIYWIVLASDPNSNEILMVTLNSTNGIWAQVWNGEADVWGNVQLIDTAASQTAYQCFDVVYESQSGYGFIAWANNSIDLKYKRWKGENGNWTESSDSWGEAESNVYWIKLASEPNSNYILAAEVNDLNRINATVWDGGTWGADEMIDNVEVYQSRCFDVAWESKSNREGLVVFGYSIDDAPHYRNVTDTTINSTDSSAIDANPIPSDGDPNWIILKSDPQSDNIMMMYLVNDPGLDDIGVELWNGTLWEKNQSIEQNSDLNNGQRFDLSYTDTSGYFISQPYDAKIVAPWGRILWTADVPNETTLQIRTRTSSNGINWSSWSNWATNGDRITSPDNRWIQYQVWFETKNISFIPTLYDVTIELSHADLIINGTPGENFGWSVSKAGDLNQDGYDDIIIGGPQNNSASGSAYIFHGNFITTESAIDRYIDLANGDLANVTLIGDNTGDLFGYSVSQAGNFSNDGICDVIVGAPGSSQNGTIHIFFGGPWMSSIIQAMNSNFTQMGENANDNFGWSVSWAGNVDGDLLGYEEIIVGSPFIDDGGSDSGKVYVIHLFHQPDLWINGSENDVYKDVPSGSQVNLSFLDAGTNTSWLITLQNDGELEDTIQFTITTNMLFDWSWELREDSTWTRFNDGDNVSLAMGEQKTFTLNISSPLTAVHGDESWIEISATSQNDTLKKDSVRAAAKAVDLTKPEIMNTTPGTPTTDDPINITATVTDNILLDSVYLYYWFDLYPAGIDGPHNYSMDPGFIKEIIVPINAVTLHYNISAKDTSNNWNETFEITIAVLDNDLPTILDTTGGIPVADDNFTINATVNDNIEVDEVYLNYWYYLLGGGTDGPYNVSMNPGYSKIVDVPADALTLNYSISANDTSDNWKQTIEYTRDVHEIVLPEINDTTSGSPKTGDPFMILANVTDNFGVDSVHIYFWFTTTGQPTNPQNFTMNDLGGGNFDYTLDIPINAIELHYNISANDTSNNWNQTGVQILDVQDDDLPELSDIISNPSSQVIGDQVNITLSISDNIGISEVGINISLLDGSWMNTSMNPSTGNTWYIVTAFGEIGKYNFTIWVNDTTGNLNQSEVYNFTMTPLPPTVDYILIRTQPNGAGEVPSTIVFALDDTAIFYAAGYNSSYGFLDDLEVSWSSSHSYAGSINPDYGSSTNFTASNLGTGSVIATYNFTTHNFAFEVVVSQKPEFIGVIPNIDLTEDSIPSPRDFSSYAFHPEGLLELKWIVTDVDESIITISGQNLIGNHILHFVPQADKFGNFEVEYWLVYDDENKISQRAWINISPVNDPPRISDSLYHIVHYDIPYSFDYTPYLRDIDNSFGDLTLMCDETTYATVSGFIVTYNYPESMIGEVYVTITVSDGEYSQDKLIKITITSDNPPHTILDLPDVPLFENEIRLSEFDLDEYFTDSDGDTLKMSVGYSNVDITINENHTVDFAATGEWSGSEMVTFRAEDPMGARAEQTIIVTVTPVNDPPIIKQLPTIYVHFNHSYTFDLQWYISDKDNEIEELVIETSDPGNITINGTVLDILYPKIEGIPGNTYTVPLTIEVSDGVYNVSADVTIIVGDNFPPTVRPALDDVSLFEDEILSGAYDLDDHFFDLEGAQLTFTFNSAYINVTIHENNTVDFTPPPNWFGWELILIRGTDEGDAFFEELVMVTVLPVNDPPSIADIPLQKGQKGESWVLDLTDYISDIDNELGNLTVTVNSPYVEIVGYVLVFNYPANMTEDTVWITVSDGELETTTAVNVLIESSTTVPDIGAWILSIPPIVLIVAILVLLLVRRGIYVLEDLFLITKSGLLIEHTGTTRDYEKGDEKDEDILAGMFVAVQEFIRDSFGGEEEEHLKRLDYGDKTVLIYRGDYIILASFLTGRLTKPFYKKMRMFVEDVEEHYEGEVEDWSGDIADLPEIEIKLHSLLEGRYPKNNRKNNQYESDEEEEEEVEEEDKMEWEEKD